MCISHLEAVKGRCQQEQTAATEHFHSSTAPFPYYVWKVLSKECGFCVRWIGMAGCMCILNYVIQKMVLFQRDQTYSGDHGCHSVFGSKQPCTRFWVGKWFGKNTDDLFGLCVCTCWYLEYKLVRNCFILICIEIHLKITSPCSIGLLIFIAKFLHLWA